MPPELCRICEASVPFSETVHVLLHTRSEAGVVDYYVCRGCYEERLAPLFENSGGVADDGATSPLE